MGKINVLDKHIAELIAAGEVVERPSSVIKELLENSIDSGATAVTVEIKNGGISFMRVTDNGCGIMREDVRTAFLRHATSKVRSQNDLDSIITLGFRGEALASICAVSRVEMLTRSTDEETGTSYKIQGGDETEIAEVGCPVGTTIIVRDLFYNVPARMKFLKKDISEGNAVSAVMDKIALSHPEIAFIYIKDGKQMFKTAGDSNLKSAVYTVYGKDFANSLIPVDYELNGVKVAGYISRPDGARPNRNMQNFFINGRYIKSRTASVALEEASKGSVMVGKFLSCVLHIQISCKMVDMNVHPAKIEVRFINERPIFDAVYHAVQSALLTGDERKHLEIKSSEKNTASVSTVSDFHLSSGSAFKSVQGVEPFKNAFNIPVKKHSSVNTVLRDIGNPLSNRTGGFTDNESSLTITVDNDDYLFADAVRPQVNVEKVTTDNNEKSGITIADDAENKKICVDENENFIPDIDSKSEQKDIKPLIDIDSSTFKYIGEAFKTYIIIEKNGSELVIIDKHAAHERIIYEKLKNGDAQIFEQGLLSPVLVTLDKIDYNSVIENTDVFRKLRFDVEDFGSGTVIVRSVPQFLENTDISQTVIEIAGFLTENKQDLNTEKMDWIFHSIACRGAVKAGNTNSPEELIELAMRVENDPSLRYCPHGRPICVVITKSELEKQFGRV